MKRSAGIIAALAMLLIELSCAGCFQMAQEPPASQALTGRALRVAYDHQTGGRWLLLRDQAHPAWPAHWIKAIPDDTESASSPHVILPLPIVIRAGDWVTVQEQTQSIHAQLDAIALEPAKRGFELWARLRINGIPVRVIAVAPGRAIFAPARKVEE